MGAQPPVLSEEEYNRRRKYLGGQLTLAERELGEAELSSASAQDWASDVATEDKRLVTARGKVVTIEGKLRGLDAAWERSKEVNEARESADQIRARNEAAHKIEQLFTQYAEHVVNLEKGIMALRPDLSALAQLPNAMITTMLPHQRALNADTASMWLSMVRSTDWLKQMIDGCFYSAGFSRLGFTPHNQQSNTIGSDVLIERLTKNILSPLAPLLEGEQSSGEN